MEFFILNESRNPNIAGDVTLFSSLASLTVYVEAIDVRNREYGAFTSTGRKITLSAKTDYSKVTYELENHANFKLEVGEILFEHLMFLARLGKFNLDPIELNAARGNLVKLVELVPDKILVKN